MNLFFRNSSFFKFTNRSDPVAFICNPIRMTKALIQGDSNVKLVGSFRKIPFSTHSFLHEEYQEALEKNSQVQRAAWYENHK